MKKTATTQKHISIGLDLSLTGTGLVVLSDGKPIHAIKISSKPDGKTPKDELNRLRSIVSSIDKAVDVAVPIGSKKVTAVVAIEGLAFMARNTTALVQLAGLNYMVRNWAFDRGFPFIIVAPTSLKKFITGKGNADKSLVMLEIYKQYEYTSLDDNVADAFGLAVIAHAHYTSPKLPQYQQEVINLLKTQI